MAVCILSLTGGLTLHPLRWRLHLQRPVFAQFDCCICPWYDRCSCEMQLQSVECIGPVANDELGWVQIAFAV